MPAPTLTALQRREKRAAAHALKPVVMIGGDGLTDAVVKEADVALAAHGLIKARVFIDDRAAREALLADLAARLDAAPVQHIGKLLVLWRPPRAKEREASATRGAGPRQVKIVKFAKSGSHRPTIKRVTVAGNQRVTAGGSVKRKDARRTTARPSPKKAG